MADGPTQPRSLEDLISNGYAVQPFNYLEEGWQAFRNYPLGFIAFALVFIVISQALPLLTPVFGQLLSIAVQVIMMAGIAMATWGQLRNRTSTFADFFPDWKTVGRLVVSTVLALLLIAAGLLLFVLPGIYLIVAYSFSYMLIADRHLGAWQALEASRRVVTRNWWGIFWLTGVMLLLIMGGGIFGAALLGFPLGYVLTGYFPEVSLDDLPLVLPETGAQVNLGMMVGLLSGTMIGGGLGIALSGCMFGAAYADIFGLASPPPQTA